MILSVPCGNCNILLVWSRALSTGRRLATSFSRGVILCADEALPAAHMRGICALHIDDKRAIAAQFIPERLSF